jgi:hypothetical protein
MIILSIRSFGNTRKLALVLQLVFTRAMSGLRKWNSFGKRADRLCSNGVLDLAGMRFDVGNSGEGASRCV